MVLNAEILKLHMYATSSEDQFIYSWLVEYFEIQLDEAFFLMFKTWDPLCYLFELLKIHIKFSSDSAF